MVVSAGAVAFALITALWAFRFTQSARRADAGWRRHAEKLENRLDRADALLASHPGVVMTWDDEGEWAPGAWGHPKLYGAPAALASLLRFADASDGPNLGGRILDGLADYEGRDAAGEVVTLRRALGVLRASGAPFSVVIEGPGGLTIEADGRPAGARMALWLADPALKTAETAAARGRLEEARLHIMQDPAAFMEMWGRTPVLAWRLSSGLKLQWANTAFLEAVEAQSLDDAMERDLALDAQARAQARQALADGARVYHTRSVTVGGALRTYEISCFPVSGGVAGVALDITAAEEARATLEQQLRRQTAALNRVDDGVAIFSLEKELVFSNDAFAQLFGLEAGWLNEKPGHGALLDRLRERRLLPETDDYETWRARELQAYLKTAEDPSPEIWRLPDGRMISMAPLRPQTGGVILVFRDMTERLRLETELNTRVKVQRATLDKLTEGVVVFGSDGKLRLHNAAFQAMWRLDEGVLEPSDGAALSFDALAAACRDLLPEPAVWTKMKARVTNPSQETRREITEELQRADGAILNYTSRPLPDGATAIVFEDVTAERELKKVLTDRARLMEDRARLLEAHTQVRADFVGLVSRSLRDPLQTILGRAELMQMDVEEGARAVASEDVAQILQAGRELNQLVETILQLAAASSDSVELNLAEVAVRPALESALLLVSTRAEDSKVRFTLDCPDDIGELRADPERLSQVVYNLLWNARQRARPDGHVALGAARDGASVRIWVEDDGPAVDGVDAEGTADDPFIRYDQAGAGLSLTLVKEYVGLHRGWVELRFGPDAAEAAEILDQAGARVTCTFPHIPEGRDPAGAPLSAAGPMAAAE